MTYLNLKYILRECPNFSQQRNIFNHLMDSILSETYKFVLWILKFLWPYSYLFYYYFFKIYGNQSYQNICSLGQSELSLSGHKVQYKSIWESAEWIPNYLPIASVVESEITVCLSCAYDIESLKHLRTQAQPVSYVQSNARISTGVVKERWFQRRGKKLDFLPICSYCI